MHAEDIQGSIAYAKALKLAGVLEGDEELKIVNGLMQVGKEWINREVHALRLSLSNWHAYNINKFQIKPEDEDIHTANERRLKELVGPVGGKLHTGRSRNDQVATDMRLWLINEIEEIETALKALLTVMVDRADNEKAHLLPGYTHLQVSFPVSFFRPDQCIPCHASR
jgi:argininosuccinate lyase